MIKIKILGWLVVLLIVVGSTYLNLSYKNESVTATIPEIGGYTLTPEKAVTMEAKYISLGKFRITAYCSCHKCCGIWAKNRPLDKYGREIIYTATGERAEPRKTISVDLSVIPFGSTVLIDGQEYSADDSGSAIRGKRIDMYFSNHNKALKYGVQYVEVFLIRGE